jgi:ADP-dependent phosphofructokinase/glucokinase
VRSAVLDVHAQVHIPLLVLHTKYFAIAHGRDAHSFKHALSQGVAVAGARYAHGDEATKAEIQRLAADGERGRVGTLVVSVIEQRDSEFAGAPALELANVAWPTTVGLGDAFIGGAIAALLENFQ